MQQRLKVPASARAVLAIVTLAALSACGGGGGDSTPATVTSMTVAATKYGTPALITIQGTHLTNLALQSSGCKSFARLTTAPTASTDTTAYWSCTPSGSYSSSILAISNGQTLNTQPFTVPAPIVTMTVTGPGGINGSIVFNLKGNTAPTTVDNFLRYVNSGFYTGTIFHRVIDFNNPQAGPEYDVVQGGSYTSATSGTLPAPKATPYDPIAFEATGGGNVQWTAAMARTNDLNSATSGFFFNVKNNTAAFDPSSGPGYAVFADVSTSAAIITQISQISGSACTSLVPSGFNDGSCVPIPNVQVTTATQTQ
jgi:cyclophilin family peptidyl-prolyl cis-trans isomerase